MHRYLIAITAFVLFNCSLFSSLRINEAITKGHLNQSSFKYDIPFKSVNGFIIVTTIIEGKPYDFLFDTGAPTVIESDLAKNLAVKKIGQDDVSDSKQRSKKLTFVKINELKIGELDFLETTAVVADFNFMKTESCLSVSGIIGSNLMNKAIWQINYEEQKIVISDRRDFLEIPDKSISVDFKVNRSGIPRFIIRLNNHFQEVILDTGSNAKITLTNECRDILKDSVRFVTGYGITSGFFGSTLDSVSIGSINSLLIGDSLEIKKEVVVFRNKTLKCIVGNDFLKDYLITIDWNIHKLTFSKTTTTKQLTLDSFGFTPKFRNNKLIVGFLYRGSPADKMGLRLNEQILKINHWDFTKINKSNYCDFIDSGIMNKVNQLSIVVNRDEKEVIIKLTKDTLIHN